jgi:hypothetical protein
MASEARSNERNMVPAPIEWAVIEPTLRELQAVAKHATDRLGLYRRRVYVGRGNLPRLAELTRIADGAAKRLATAKEIAARAASRRSPRS